MTMIRTIIAVAAFVFAPLANAGKPVASPDALEATIIGCIAKLPKTSGCSRAAVEQHILPGFDNLVSAAEQVDDLTMQWLAKERVFAVHPIGVKRTGDLFEQRTYLIEDTSGALMMFEFSALKRLGNWYMFAFNINSNEDVVEAVLKGDR